MYPEVYTGDLFIIMKQNYPSFTINLGDILVYTTGEYNIGHRVVGIYDNFYLTKGDNNQNYEHVYNSQIIGKVVKTINRYNPIGQWITARVAG